MVLFIGILIYDRSFLKIRLNDIWIFFGAGVFSELLLNICYNESINRLTLSLAAVLLCMAPIFVIIISALLFKEKITKAKLFCMILAITGCVLNSGVLESSSNNLSLIGIIVGIASAFFYALFSIFSRAGMNHGYNAYTIVFYSIGIFAVLLIPFTDWDIVTSYVLKAPLENFTFLFGSAIVNSCLPYLLLTISMIYIDTGTASLLASGGEPVSASVFGMLVFAEAPTIMTISGLIITVIALTLLCKADQRRKV